ncbi:MAG: hypothetical protein V7651_08105 [Hyphomonas oceanitis]|uniref:hypothetical protein n=1 Tax=Hyphomonas oceanitis TaxID=81033 RepID=UPI00300350DA
MNFEWPDIVFAQQTVSSNEVWSALAGVLIGGAITFGTSYWFKKREQRIDLQERDFELYIELNRVINDVWAIGSRYLPALDKHGWPTAPWSVMQPAIGETNYSVRIPARLLSTIRSKSGKGLTHKALEMANFRNIIMVANSQFQELHTKVVEMGAPYADISQGMRMSADLDARLPEHKTVIVATERANSLAKQLLKLILDFYDYAIDFAGHYNTYHSTHKNKVFHKLLIDISGIQADMSKYSTKI